MIYLVVYVLALVVVVALYLRIRADDLRGLDDDLGMMEEEEVMTRQ